MDKKTKRISVGLLAFYSAAVPMLWSQATSDNDIIVLDEVQAEDVPIEESILATTRPITSVYGTERSVLDTPRNVNIISREQLDAISIRDVRDFSKLTSSSYTKTNFGAPTSPNLRGQEGDLFINGIRRGHSTNGNGVPINFNSVESVNIVKGPAGAVFGTSNYVGGYADLITKRAFFENAGSAEFSVGSYDQYTVNLDVNVPISETLAFRLSFEGKEWEGFWDNWYNKSQSVYSTIAWRPNEKYSLDVMGEYYKGNYTENWGVNRITQDLFDNGRYLPNDQTDAQYLTHIANLGNGVGFFFGPGAVPPTPTENNPTIASLFGDGGFQTYSPIDPNNTVPVDRSWKLSAPGDDSNATVFWAQALQQLTVSDSLKILNNTYFHYKDRSTHSSYHYSEIMKDNWSIDNRIQAIQEFEPQGIEKITLNYGVRIRYQEIMSANHFYNEPVNFWDLTRQGLPGNSVVPDQAFSTNFQLGKSVFLAGQDPRGGLSRWWIGAQDSNFNGILEPDEVTAGNSESTTIAPFLQADIKFTDKFSFLAGYTIDYVDHTEYLSSDIISNGTPVSADFYDKFDFDGNFFNANASIVFKPTKTTAVYLTYNEGQHYSSDTGGRIVGSSLNDDLRTELIELGFNASLFDGKVYLGAALFNQKYTTRDQDGSVGFIETDGFEIEVNYQPNRNLFATLGFSIVDSVRTTSFFASSYTADRAGETGGFYISPNFDIDDTIEFENPGVPEHLLNALVQYKFDNGFGVQANLLMWGEMNSGYGGHQTTVRLPDGTPVTLTGNTARLGLQYEIDAKIFYEYEAWRFELSAFNITDEENWDVNNSGYGNGSAIARSDTNFEVSVKYSW